MGQNTKVDSLIFRCIQFELCFYQFALLYFAEGPTIDKLCRLLFVAQFNFTAASTYEGESFCGTQARNLSVNQQR
jgi:hypothetical protein